MITEKNQPSGRSSGYNAYVAAEWEMFLADPARTQALLESTRDVRVETLLDIGCGAGQEMLPFIRNGARGIGLDAMPQAGEVGRKMFDAQGLLHQVQFVRGDGSVLPFGDRVFDLVICRVALMYMDNKCALAELSRVLKPSGIFLLKYHAPAYYWHKFGQGFRRGHVRSSIHAARVLYAGYFYKILGRQPFNKLSAAGEVFQTASILDRELRPLNMKIVGTMPDSNRQSPSVVIAKSA